MKIHELFQDDGPCPWPNSGGAKSLFTDPGTDEWKTLARAPVGSEAWFRAWFSRPFLTNGHTKNEISQPNEKSS